MIKVWQSKRRTTHGQSSGGRTSHEYNSWSAMHQRCNNLKNDDYRLYGGRGITVCERWSKFENFLADMGKRPTADHSIDRFPDKGGNYEPDNCRWASDPEQTRNMNRNVFVTYKGETLCLADWARRLHLTPGAVTLRIKSGWSPERAVSTPARRRANG